MKSFAETMEMYLCVGITALFHIVSSSHLHIATKMSKQISYEGGNVTLACTVVGDEFNAFLHPIIWYKLSHDEETQYQINSGAVILSPFDATNRYFIEPSSKSQPHSQVEMPLIISDVTLAENGSYRCDLRSRYKVLSSVTHRIIVPAAVESLTFTSSSPNHTVKEPGRNTSSDHVALMLTEGRNSTLSCEIRGGNPRHQLHVYQGDTDISHRFERTESVNVVGKPGLQTEVHDVKLTDKSYRAVSDDRGATLRCVARVSRFPHLRRMSTRELEVRYAPKFDCANRFSAVRDSGNYTIECSTHSNPAVDGHSVHWSFEDVDINDSVVQNNLYPGDAIGVFTTSSRVNPDTGRTDVSLFISNVTMDTYRMFTLVASNQVGMSKHRIQFVEAVPTVEPSTKDSIWKVDYNEKGVYKINNENDVIKASSSHSDAAHATMTSSLLGLILLTYACLL